MFFLVVLETMNTYKKTDEFNAEYKLNGLIDVVHINMCDLDGLEKEFDRVKENIKLILSSKYADDLMSLLKPNVYSDLEKIKGEYTNAKDLTVCEEYAYLPTDDSAEFPHYFMALFIFPVG